MNENDFVKINNNKKRKISSSYNPAPIDKMILFITLVVNPELDRYFEELTIKHLHKAKIL